MLNGYKKEEIERLIKKGFDLELISFELDIPIEELKPIEIELKSNSLKMQKLRERYNNAYFTKKQNDKNLNIKLEKKEENKIDKKILEIKTIAEDLEGKAKSQSKTEASKKIDEILKLILQLKSKRLTLEQCESLYKIIESEEIQQKLNYFNDKNGNFKIKKSKKIINEKLLEFIDFAQNNTNDIEQLKTLNEKITIEIMQNNPIKASTIKNKIMNKIIKFKTKQIEKQQTDNVPKYIDDIVNNIINENFDKEKIDEIINKEAEKIYLNRKNKTFYASKNQEKEKNFIQIKTAISKNVRQYQIERPDIIINRLYELCGEPKENSIGAVVQNLINSKRFEEARKTCNQFLIKEGEGANYRYIRILKDKIRTEELGDMILKGIKSEKYQDDKCFELIEEGLKLGNISLKEIKLGENQDGSRIITLEDIWDGKEKDNNTR